MIYYYRIGKHTAKRIALCLATEDNYMATSRELAKYAKTGQAPPQDNPLGTPRQRYEAARGMGDQLRDRSYPGTRERAGNERAYELTAQNGISFPSMS
jgi:hypothetical protein